MKIPFNKPSLIGRELEYIQDAISHGHVSGDGVYTKKCTSLLEVELGVKKVLLTTSCTHALEMAAILLDIRPGDEVIVPSFLIVFFLSPDEVIVLEFIISVIVLSSKF